MDRGNQKIVSLSWIRFYHEYCIMAIPDPDVIRWGLHHLLDVCSPGNFGSPYTITGYDKDMSEVAYVREDYCHNDEMLARAYQEELSRVASGSSSYEDHPQQVSVLAQDWNNSSDYQSAQYGAGYPEQFKAYPTLEGTPVMVGYDTGSPEIEDDSMLDGEVGRRLNQMCPIAHVPKINGEIPTVDEATSDHQRLLDRLQLYDLVELKVSGDGNCQFRSLSDQIYRTTEHHKFVREQIVHQLQSRRELYEGYVPMAYDEYMKKMSRNGEWGDHVTLQAAADSYGVRILVITSFKDTCYIEILPQDQKSNRVITLSFWAEVHYNSIYPPGEFPELETKKKKKWWWPVI